MGGNQVSSSELVNDSAKRITGSGLGKVLIIVPTYNEKDNLSVLVKRVLEELNNAEMLIVDDASPDGTGELADDLAAGDSRIHVIHRSGKLGLGTAYICGFKWALERDYGAIFEMDADFSHDPADLPRFVAAMEQDREVSVVLGSRYVKGGGTVNWGILRKIISRGGSLYARTILGVPIRDLTGGFKLFRRSTLEAIDLEQVQSEGYAFQIEMTYRCFLKGLKVREIPIMFIDRRVGQSKMSRKIFLEAIVRVWQLRLGLGKTRRESPSPTPAT